MTPAPIASPAVTASANGAVLTLTVVPRASKTGMERLADGTIRVRLAAPPVDGAANTALLRFLADALNVSRSRLAITSGATGRRKRVVIEGFDIQDLNARLRDALSCNS